VTWGCRFLVKNCDLDTAPQCGGSFAQDNQGNLGTYFLDAKISGKRVDPDALDDAILAVKESVGLPLTGYLGIGSKEVPEVFKVSSDIFQVLRCEVAKAEKHDKWSVWHNEPLRESAQPLPKVEMRED